MFELWMSWIKATILAIATQIVRATTFSISVTLTLAVTTVANAIASGHLMTFLAAPVAVSFDRLGATFFN